MREAGSLRVALTIDVEHPDRPTTVGVAEGILDTLAREGVPVTCFIQGRWALAYPGLAARIAAEGHLIGSHAHHHVPLPMLTLDGLRREIRDAGTAIRDTTRVDPRPWFRCPFGAGEAASRTTAVLAESGYRPSVPWDVDGLDWEAADAAEVETRVVDGVLAHGDGAIVLLHSWPAPTRGALPAIVRRLRDAGAVFVRRTELSERVGRSPRS
jgi:peptidoglycan-N-acetylglucosamine deacetylase